MSTGNKRYNEMYYQSKGFSKLMVFAMEKIDPELASALLGLNKGNRPMKNPTVEQYTKDMESGNWEFTGDIINISKTGKLLNGQHRLESIVRSGTTQMFNIQCGLEDKVFDHIDIGRKRSSGDALAINGFKNYNTVAAMVSFIRQYREGKLGIASNVKEKRYAISEVVQYAEGLDKDRLEQYSYNGGTYGKRLKAFSPSTYGALMYIFSELNREDAFTFFDALTTGENLSMESGSAILLLRNKLISFIGTPYNMRSTDKLAFVLKAWNYFRRKKEIKQLSWQEKEEFPVAI